MSTRYNGRADHPPEGTAIIEHVKTTLRRHPLAGWGVIVFIVLAGAITAANQFVLFFKNLGWL